MKAPCWSRYELALLSDKITMVSNRHFEQAKKGYQSDVDYDPSRDIPFQKPATYLHHFLHEMPHFGEAEANYDMQTVFSV